MADTNQLNTDMRRLLIAMRLIHSLFLASVLIAVLIVALLPELDWVPAYNRRDPLLRTIEIVLGGFSGLCLVVGLLWPRLARWHKTANRTRSDAILGHILRVSFLEPIVLLGLSLGVIGSSWFVLAPLFLLVGASLVLTFPTNRRLARWQGRAKTFAL